MFFCRFPSLFLRFTSLAKWDALWSLCLISRSRFRFQEGHRRHSRECRYFFDQPFPIGECQSQRVSWIEQDSMLFSQLLCTSRILCAHTIWFLTSSIRYDPEVTASQIWLDLTNYGEIPIAQVEKSVSVAESAVEACRGADAVVIATVSKGYIDGGPCRGAYWCQDFSSFSGMERIHWIGLASYL